MREPVMRRTRSGALSFQAPARHPSPLAKALSLLSVCSVLAFAAPLPLQAADAATITSIESPKAVTKIGRAHV